MSTVDTALVSMEFVDRERMEDPQFYSRYHQGIEVDRGKSVFRDERAPCPQPYVPTTCSFVFTDSASAQFEPVGLFASFMRVFPVEVGGNP